MSGRRPKDLVFTLFGEYLLDRDDAVWVGALISLLEPLGLSEGAVRTALSRMARKGWLEAEREGRRSYYRLTARGRRLLEEGHARIYHTTWDHQWDGAWVLLAYSIPEVSRLLRDRLRDRLAWLGFGSLGNGLWISPHDVLERVRAVTEVLGLGEHVECFRAHRVSDTPVEELVSKCWDLDALDEAYARFAGDWAGTLARHRDGRATEGVDQRESYVLRFSLIHEFRAFLLEDPYLPRRLLPGAWHGDEANRVFHDTHALLVGPADAYVASVLADAARSRRARIGV